MSYVRKHATRFLFAAFALSLSVVLLVADSTGPRCKGGEPFDRTFDATTTCGGNRTERVRISAISSETECFSVECWNTTVTTLDGEPLVEKAEPYGRCTKDGAVLAADGVRVTVSVSDPSGVWWSTYDCSVNFATSLGIDVPCEHPDSVNPDASTTPPCTLRLDPVQ